MSNATKPVNPYSRLKESVQEWALKVMHPRTRHLYKFQDAKNSGTWELKDVYAATYAADKCSYDVILRCDGDSLVMELRQRPGDAPWEVRA